MRRSVKLNGILSIIQKSCHVLIPLLIFPYLTRTLGAENYGKFSFANSIISYFILAAMLGVNTYAIREGARIRDDKEELTKFTSEVFSINIVSGVIAVIVLFLAVFWSPKLYQYNLLIYIMSFIIPATVLGRDYINTIYEDYLYITIRYIIVQIVGILLIFALIHNPNDYVIYTGIYTFTTSIGYIINLFYTKKYIPIKFTYQLNLKRHTIPILILFFGQIATTIYIQSDITMIGIYQNDFDVGVYTFASKIYVLSKGMINALTTVAIPRIVYYLGKDNMEYYNSFASRLFDYLLSLTLPFAIGLLILGSPIIHVVGGPEYVSGTTSLKVLSIALLIAVFSGFFCNAILVPNRKEKQFLYITVLSAMINIVLNLILIPRIGIVGAAITTLISEFVVVVAAYSKSRQNLKLSISLRNLFLTVLGSAIVAIVCFIAMKKVDSDVAKLVICVPASLVGYFSIHMVFKNPLYYTTTISVLNKLKRSKK